MRRHWARGRRRARGRGLDSGGARPPGSCFLFYGSLLLIFEARLALSTTDAEADLITRLGNALAPADLTTPRSHRIGEVPPVVETRFLSAPGLPSAENDWT